MSFITVLKYFAIWQLILIGVSLLAQTVLPLRTNYLAVSPQIYQTNPALYSRANFDGFHYLRIVQQGYVPTDEPFFPFYPLLIKGVGSVIGSQLWAGIIISNVCLLLALYFFTKLLAFEGWPNSASKIAVWLMLIFPTSFFLGAVYAESLLLLWVILAFYLARRSNWSWAGMVGALAAFSRFVGVLLWPALLVELILQKQVTWRNLAAISLIPIGLLLYMGFLQLTTGDGLAFFKAQASYGEFRSLQPILFPQVFWRYAKMVVTVGVSNPIYLNIILELAIGILFLVTTLYGFWKQRLSYAVFNGLAYLFPTLTGSFVSLPRYVLVCLPSFMLLALFLQTRSKWLRWSYYVVSALLSIWLTMLYVRGYWIA